MVTPNPNCYSINLDNHLNIIISFCLQDLHLKHLRCPKVIKSLTVN